METVPSRMSSAEKPCWQCSQMLQSGLCMEGAVWGRPDFSTDSATCLTLLISDFEKRKIKLLFLCMFSDTILYIFSGTCRGRLGRTVSQLYSSGTRSPESRGCYSWETGSQKLLFLGATIPTKAEHHFNNWRSWTDYTLPCCSRTSGSLRLCYVSPEANSQAEWSVSREWGSLACEGQIWSQQHLNSFLWWSGNSEKSGLLLRHPCVPISTTEHLRSPTSRSLTHLRAWNPAGRSALYLNKDAFWNGSHRVAGT